MRNVFLGNKYKILDFKNYYCYNNLDIFRYKEGLI